MIDAIATEPHFADHIIPIWKALPEAVRGKLYLRFPRPGVPDVFVGAPPASHNPTLVAAIGDLRRGRGRRMALMEHGCGQSFGGDPRTANAASYAGGSGRGEADLFLHPGEHPAARDRARYPKANIEVVGCAKLDDLPDKGKATKKPVVAVSFHWNCRVAPETMSAERIFRAKVAKLADMSGFTVIGHGHPRIIRRLEAWYRRSHIETVHTFEEVCRRADVYVNDASSTLFEFASTGRPVVVLNPRIYRRNVDHGLRFWEAATVGVSCTETDDLEAVVRLALNDPPEQQAAREAALDLVYAYRTGGAARAAAALVAWAA